MVIKLHSIYVISTMLQSYSNAAALEIDISTRAWALLQFHTVTKVKAKRSIFSCSELWDHSTVSHSCK